MQAEAEARAKWGDPESGKAGEFKLVRADDQVPSGGRRMSFASASPPASRA